MRESLQALDRLSSTFSLESANFRERKDIIANPYLKSLTKLKKPFNFPNDIGKQNINIDSKSDIYQRLSTGNTQIPLNRKRPRFREFAR